MYFGGPDKSIELNLCDCDWSGPCNLCKMNNAIRDLQSLGNKIPFVVKKEEDLLKERQALRSGMIRETLIEAQRIALNCKSKFRAQDYNDAIEVVIGKLGEAFYQELERYEKSLKKE